MKAWAGRADHPVLDAIWLCGSTAAAERLFLVDDAGWYWRTTALALVLIAAAQWPCR